MTPITMTVTALLLIGFCPPRALAQSGHSQMDPESFTAHQNSTGALLKIVRDSTERFKHVAAAEAEGYTLQFRCVTGPGAGAMGLHYVNGQFLNSGLLDAARPTIVIYEPTANGGLRLIGADFVLFADAWNKSHSGPPKLMGQVLHLFDARNRFGLPAFYTLHVWAWKDNPNGAFENWHPNVSCASFAGKSL